MIRKILSIMVLLFSICSFSQETVLYSNKNNDAKELIHYLNPTKDSLILTSEFTIHKVEFYIGNSCKTFETLSKRVVLPLRDLSEGRHPIGVFVNSKIVMINIEIKKN